VSGCSESIAAEAGRLPTLGQLSNVHLGMRAYALRRARPKAEAAPYFGFREEIGSIDVMYEVPGSVQDGQAPPWWEALESVVAVEHFAGSADVRALWQKAAGLAAKSIEGLPKCYALESPDRDGWLAIWSRGSDEVFVAGQVTMTATHGVTSGTIVTGVGRTGRGLGRGAFPPSMIRPCAGLLTQ
jgi:hypothetical protein